MMRGFEAEFQPQIDGIDPTAGTSTEGRVVRVDSYPIRSGDLEGRLEHRIDVALHRLGPSVVERHFRGPNIRTVTKPTPDQQQPLQ